MASLDNTQTRFPVFTKNTGLCSPSSSRRDVLGGDRPSRTLSHPVTPPFRSERFTGQVRLDRRSTFRAMSDGGSDGMPGF